MMGHYRCGQTFCAWGLCALLLGVVACDDSLNERPLDAARRDSGIDAKADLGKSNDSFIDECVGKQDGVACGVGGTLICLAEQCVSSSCGDGYINKAADEECEDGNEVDGDGCTQCRLDCKSDSDCDDGESCNGSEACDTSSHVCLPAAPAADGTACQLSGGAEGACNGGVCVKAGCGNGVKDGSEQCDDGNQTNGDGCENDCTWSCQSDADCDDNNPCTGAETCDKSDPKKPICKPGVAVSCTSSKPGCTGACDSNSGQCVFADNDKDDVGCDKDCEDNDPSIFPGAKECADGKDNDCDPGTPDGKDGDCKCYVDKDGDGFSSSTTGSITAVTCPPKYTSKAPTNSASTDCFDTRADVRPNQTTFFTKSYCRKLGIPKCLKKSWDYNCDAKIDKQHKTLYDSTKGCRKFMLPPPLKGAICAGSGWTATTVPACGKKASYVSCTLLKGSCVKISSIRTQGCR